MAKQTVIIEYKGDVDDLIKSLNKTAKANVKVSKGADKVGRDYEKATKKAESANERLGKSINKVGSIIGTVFAVSSLIQFGKASLRLYDIQAKAEQGLLVALKGRKKAQESLIRQAQQLQKVTLFGDEETIKAQSLIAAFVQEENQIKRIIPLVQDLATAKGMDLAGAADLVSKTLGSSTNALSRYGIQVEGAVGSSQRLESLAKGLTDAFGGQAEAAAKAGTGGVTQLANRWGDLSEKFGEFLMKHSGPVLNFLDKLITKTERAASGVKGFIDEVGAGDVITKSAKSIFDEYNKVIQKTGDSGRAFDFIMESLVIHQDRVKKSAKETSDALKEKESSILSLLPHNQKQITLLQYQAEADKVVINDLVEFTKKIRGTAGEQDKLNEVFKEYGLIQENIIQNQSKVDPKKAIGILDDSDVDVKKARDYFKAIREEFLKEKPIPSIKVEEEGIFSDERIIAEIEAQKELNKRIQEEERKHQEELARISKDTLINSANSIAQDLSTIQSDRIAEEVAIITKGEQDKLSALQDRLNKGIISQEEFIKRSDAIQQKADQQRRRLQKEELDTKKAIAIFNATINTAEAVTKALTLGPVLGPILAGVVAGAGAVQIGVINSEQIPQFEDGGLIGGKRHKEGGTLIEAEKGEWITNRLMTKKYHQELEAINSNRFNDLLMTKYILPAIVSHKRSETRTFDDWNLLNSDKKTQKLLGKLVENTTSFRYNSRFK